MARHRPGAKRSFQDIDLSRVFDGAVARSLVPLWRKNRVRCGGQVTETREQRTDDSLNRPPRLSSDLCSLIPDFPLLSRHVTESSYRRMPVWGAGMEHNLFRYIWRNSWRDQSVILVVVAISYVFYFVSLDLPKQIVNQAIHEQAFAGGRTTAPLLDLSIGPIDWLGLPEVTLFEGFQLDKIAYLVALCFAFLFFVVVNGWIKQVVNTEKGRL